MNKEVKRLHEYLGAFVAPRVKEAKAEDVAEALRLIANDYESEVVVEVDENETDSA